MENFYYKKLEFLKENNEKSFPAIQQLMKQQQKDLSFASHEIINQLSFMKSSYQLLSKRKPDIKELAFWNQLGNSIETLINFMDRTSKYRYSFSNNLKSMDLTTILYSLPDIADEHYPDENRTYNFDISPKEINIMGDSENLLMAFSEIIINCVEETKEADTITISACMDSEDESCCRVRIFHPGTLCVDDTTTHKFGETFYTKKKNHVGLGLSIIGNVVSAHNGDFDIYEKDGYVFCDIQFYL